MRDLRVSVLELWDQDLDDAFKNDSKGCDCLSYLVQDDEEFPIPLDTYHLPKRVVVFLF